MNDIEKKERMHEFAIWNNHYELQYFNSGFILERGRWTYNNTGICACEKETWTNTGKKFTVGYLNSMFVV